MVNNNFSYKSVDVQQSILSSNVDMSTALDIYTPFTFFDFLKQGKQTLSPQEFNDAYLAYLKNWYIFKDGVSTTNEDNIRDRYIELLKDITLNYTTQSEKRFLSNIDYNDPTDLDVTIPFFSRKIIEICNFYKSKRDELKFKIQKNKIKGNDISINTAIYQSIVNYLILNDNDENFYNLNLSLSAVTTNMQIEVEELFDYYVNYFDIDPTKSAAFYDVNTKLRSDYFSANVNDLDYDLFLNFDNALKQAILGPNVFLAELSRLFTINYNLDQVNLNCSTDDKLFNLITTNKSKQTAFIELKKKLISKYIGTDFYYLSTGSTITDITSGKFLTALNPSGNLLNRHFPSTASIEEYSQLFNLRQIGLFFTPDKQSILHFSTDRAHYNIDYSKLLPNKIYTFPDPSMYGNTTGLTKTTYDYPLIQVIDVSRSVNNISYFAAEGNINASPYDQSFYSYFSNKQLNVDSELGLSELKKDFSWIYNKGIITKWDMDIYGNQYGLFNTDLAIKERESITVTTPVYNTFNGYQFYDDLEVNNFNFTTVGDYGTNTYRTGITANGGTFTNYTENPTTLYFRDFASYLDNPVTWESFSIYDCATFTYSNNTLLPSPISSDAANWPSSPADKGYYYTELFDGGIGALSPMVKAITGSNTLSARFTYTYDTSANIFDRIDGNYFPNTLYDYSLTNGQTKITVNTVSENNITTLQSNDNTNYLAYKNKMFFRDAITGNVQPLSSALSKNIAKYSAAVQSEIYNSITDFNILYDTIIIKTSSYILFDKIVYVDGEITYPNTQNNIIQFNVNCYNKCSMPLFFSIDTDYCFFVSASAINVNKNTIAIFPQIYKYTISKNIISKIYPTNTTAVSAITGLFSHTLPVYLNNICQPVLTYNSRNDKYAINYIAYDQNGIAYIYSVFFDYLDNTIHINKVNMYTSGPDSIIKTYNFYDNSNFTSYGIISSAPVSFASTIAFNQTNGTVTIS